MTGREKILAAMSERGTRSVPVLICYPELLLRDQWERITSEPWWMMHSEDTDVAIRCQKDLLAVTGEDRIPLWLGASRTDRERYRIEGIDASRTRRVDVVTGQVEELRRPPPGGFVRESYARQFTGEGIAITSHEQLDALFPIDDGASAEAWSADGRADRPRAMLAEFGREKMPWTQLSSPFLPLLYVWGYKQLMVACSQAPDLVAYSAARVMENALRRIAAWTDLGVELFWIQEGMTDQISPDHHRRLALPCLQQMTRTIRRRGAFSIYYYTGNPMDRIEVLLDSGADALALEEGRKHFDIDIEEVARRVDGRMALVGNLDEVTVLEPGPPDAIRAEVARQLEAGRRNGGRFLMGLGGPATPNTPIDHVRLIADTVHDLAP